MKIFRRHYVLQLYRTSDLTDIINILNPWVDEIIYYDSPFLRQVASYHLRVFGSSSAPRFFKTILAGEILRLTELEDLKASIMLALVIAYRAYNPSKGNVSLVTWLSWKIPYEVSKLVTWKVTHPISPVDEFYVSRDFDRFCDTVEIVKQIGILSEDLDLDKQTKYYYSRKVKG